MKPNNGDRLETYPENVQLEDMVVEGFIGEGKEPEAVEEAAVESLFILTPGTVDEGDSMLTSSLLVSSAEMDTKIAASSVMAMSLQADFAPLLCTSQATVAAEQTLLETMSDPEPPLAIEDLRQMESVLAAEQESIQHAKEAFEAAGRAILTTERMLRETIFASEPPQAIEDLRQMEIALTAEMGDLAYVRWDPPDLAGIAITWEERAMEIAKSYLPFGSREPDPPSGGIECRLLRVSGGSLEQLRAVLDEDLGRDNHPRCYLVPHKDRMFWEINLFNGTAEEAEQLQKVRSMGDGDFARQHEATLERSRRTAVVGYVGTSARPIIPVRFFVLEESHREAVKALADEVAQQLTYWNFHVEGYKQVANEAATFFPDGGVDLFAARAFDLVETIDGLEQWLKHYLRASEHIAESMTVKQEMQDGGRAVLHYTFSGCTVLFETEATPSLETRIRPTVRFWGNDRHKRQKVAPKIQEHMKSVILALKKCQWRPVKPNTGASFDEWFAYLDDCAAASITYTLKDLANELGYSHGYIRNLRAQYLAEKNM